MQFVHTEEPEQKSHPKHWTKGPAGVWMKR